MFSMQLALKDVVRIPQDAPKAVRMMKLLMESPHRHLLWVAQEIQLTKCYLHMQWILHPVEIPKKSMPIFTSNPNFSF